MAYVFEDNQATTGAQNEAPRFVFEDEQSQQPSGILNGAVNAFKGAGSRIAQGVNQSLGSINDAFGLDSTVYKEGAQYWDQQAQEAGSSGLPAKIYEGIGAAPAGVAEFMGNVPYAAAKGAVEGYREGGIPGALEKAALEGVKRLGVGTVFHGIDSTGITGVSKAAAMGGTMAAQTVAEQAMTDQGVQPQEVAASAITGTLLSISGGGKADAIRQTLIREGVQPDIATDLAGRYQEITQQQGTPRAIPVTGPDGKPMNVPLDTRNPEDIGPLVADTGAGSISFVAPDRQAFIRDQVESLGDIGAVHKMFPDNSPADTYARQVAAQLYGSPERDFTLGASSPVDTRTDMPVIEGEVIPPTQTKTDTREPVTVDGQIIPAGLLTAPERGFTLGASSPVDTRTDMPVIEGEVIPPSQAKTAPHEPVTVDGQIIPAGLLSAPPPTEFEQAVQYNRSLREFGQQGLMHNRGVSAAQFAESLLKQYRLAKAGETGEPTPAPSVETPARDQQSIADNKPAALDRQADVGRYVFEDQHASKTPETSTSNHSGEYPVKATSQPLFIDAQAALGKELADAHSKGELTPDLVQEKLKGLAVDRVTDFQGATFHRPTLDLAWNEHKATDRDFSYGDVDLANLGGLNAHSGSNEKANTHFRAMADIVRAEVLQDVPEARFFRHGGDEFSIVAPDTPRATLEASLVRAQESVNRYAIEQGLDAIPHPKHKAEDPHAPGIGIYYGTADFLGKESVHDIITLADQQTAKMKRQRGYDYVNRSQRETIGNKSPDASREAGLSGQSLRRGRTEGTGSQSSEGSTEITSSITRQTSPLAQETSYIDAAAHEAATSPHNDIPEPTQAQIEAGNYKKGHITLHGLNLAIENPAGSTRKGIDENGRAWQTGLEHHYGYIKGTIGRDKDHLDVFVKPGIDQSAAGDKVFVVDQKNPATGRFDEHKILLGFNDPSEARTAYLANYDKSGPKRIGGITETTPDTFKLWLKEGNTKKPFAQFSAKETIAPEPPGVILDTLGLQQIYERVANAKQVKDVMADIKALGRHVIAKGAETYPKWFQDMKQLLGSAFDKIKPVMNDVWQLIKNERGSVEMEAPRLRNAWDGILRAVNPMERGKLAEKAGELLRERMGVREMNRQRFTGQLDDAVKQYEEKTGMVSKALDSIQNSGRTLADKVFSKMTEQHAFDFMHAMDTGDKEYFADKPALRDIAAVIDSMFKAKVQEIQNLGTGAMETVRENYFPHIWEKDTDPAQIAKLMGNKPLEGSKGFTKQRVFDDVRAGLKAGYKPISQNPLDLVFLKMGEMDKYISAHKGLQAMEGMGLVQMIPAGERAPDGFTDIAGRYGIVTKQAHQDASGISGELKSYRYVAVDEVAQVFNNYLSQTLYNNKYIGAPFTAYMGAANWLNQFQLGVGSLFHAGFTSGEAVISRNALGLRALSKGDFKGAAEYFSTAIAAPVTNWKQGQKILDAMSSGSAPQGQMKDVMDWLQLAGARLGYDERFRTNQTQKTLEAWANDKPLQAVARTPLALVEQSSRIILEHIVPQQKLGVFAELMHQWIKENPQATHTELRSAAQQKWSRADARLGQVVYERYFIHNAVKNGVQALVRAPGWTGGTILEVGGGVTDALASITKLVKGESAELSDRTAYVLSLVTTTAMANGLATLFFTGEMPQDKDFLAFRTGNLDEHGKPERFVFPTYLKDIYAYSQAPGTTLMHKAHPILGLAGELANNKDYYGTEIRHPGDNPAKQIIDTVFHTATAYVPFWMRGVAKEQEREGSAMAQVAPFFGVMPAPADMNATPAEKKARELIAGHLPQGARTQDQADKAQLKRKIENALRKHDPAAGMMLADARREMVITPADEKHIRRAATTPPLVGMSGTLSFPEALQVWEKADGNEKGMLQAPFIAKGERHLRSHPEQSQETAQALRELRGSGMQRYR